MAPPALPPSADALLRAWIAGAREVLRDGIVSIRLHGGLAVGDFAPGWSDVDVCAVLRDPPGEDEQAGLARLQVERALPELPAFERLWASRLGRTLEGSRIDTAPPSRASLRARLAADLSIVEAGGCGSPVWHAGILAWMARSLAF